MKEGPAFRFHTPCSLLIVGPSGSGRTYFTQELLLDNLHVFETPCHDSLLLRGVARQVPTHAETRYSIS